MSISHGQFWNQVEDFLACGTIIFHPNHISVEQEVTCMEIPMVDLSSNPFAIIGQILAIVIVFYAIVALAVPLILSVM